MIITVQAPRRSAQAFKRGIQGRLAYCYQGATIRIEEADVDQAVGNVQCDQSDRHDPDQVIVAEASLIRSAERDQRARRRSRGGMY